MTAGTTDSENDSKTASTPVDWQKEHDALKLKHEALNLKHASLCRNIAPWKGRCVIACVALVLTAITICPIVYDAYKNVGNLSLAQAIAFGVSAIVWLTTIISSFWYTRTLR